MSDKRLHEPCKEWRLCLKCEMQTYPVEFQGQVGRKVPPNSHMGQVEQSASFSRWRWWTCIFKQSFHSLNCCIITLPMTPCFTFNKSHGSSTFFLVCLKNTFETLCPDSLVLSWISIFTYEGPLNFNFLFSTQKLVNYELFFFTTKFTLICHDGKLTGSDVLSI